VWTTDGRGHGMLAPARETNRLKLGSINIQYKPRASRENRTELGLG